MNIYYYPTGTIPVAWSSRLAQILRLPPPPSSSILVASRTATGAHSPFHPPGKIWKHILTVCVYSDLAGTISSILLKDGVRNTRRFVRIEHFGLSGVVLYQIPTLTADQKGDGDCDDDNRRVAVGVEEIFGSEEGGYEDGMSISELLDYMSAKMVYFPAYACTSFVVGQVMHAFLMNMPQTQLVPARNGFIVTYSDNVLDLRKTLHSDDDKKTLYSACATPSVGSVVESEVSDQEGDASVDSSGPPTPPRLNSPKLEGRVTTDQRKLPGHIKGQSLLTIGF